MDIQFGVTMATYNKGIFPLIINTLNSLLAQTYTNWKLYLIGDKYDPDSEFQELVKLIPKEKIVAINLTEAKERDQFAGLELWNCGGINAVNTALRMQRNDGIKFTCHLDHDDIWLPNHLQTLYDAYNQFPESVFTYTQALNCGQPMPSTRKLNYDNKLPTPCDVVHSSTSWRLDILPHEYECDSDRPGDAFMWERIKAYCISNKLKTVFVPIITVDHFQEKS